MGKILWAAAAVVLGLGASAQAQIFYAPAQAQYVCPKTGHAFDYGGSDPRVMAYAARAQTLYSQTNWTNGTLPGGNSAGHLPAFRPRRRSTAIALLYDMKTIMARRPPMRAIRPMGRSSFITGVAIRRRRGRRAWVVPATGRAAQQVEAPAKVEAGAAVRGRME